MPGSLERHYDQSFNFDSLESRRMYLVTLCGGHGFRHAGRRVEDKIAKLCPTSSTNVFVSSFPVVSLQGLDSYRGQTLV